MSFETWKPGWSDRLRDRVRNLGFHDIYNFVEVQPRKPLPYLFGDLRKRLATSEGLALVQFRETFYIDAVQRNKLQHALAMSLIRWMQTTLRTGWNHGKNLRRRHWSVLANWEPPSPLGNGISAKQWYAFREQAWLALLQRLDHDPTIDDQWCPDDDGDPIIAGVISENWPPGSMAKLTSNTAESIQHFGPLG